MATYRVRWQETLTYEKWVEAESEQEAQEFAFEDSSFVDVREAETDYDTFIVEEVA